MISEKLYKMPRSYKAGVNKISLLLIKIETRVAGDDDRSRGIIWSYKAKREWRSSYVKPKC